MATSLEIPDNRPMRRDPGGGELVAPADWPTGGADREARKPRVVVVVAVIGSGAGVALYPLAFLLAQVLAGSCRDGGLETLGSCILGGLASLVLAALIVCGAAGLLLRRAGVRLAAVVAVLVFITATLLAWRLLYAFNDLQAVLGRGVVWIGAIAFPMLFVGWFLLLRGGRRDSLVGLGEIIGVLLLLAGFLAPALVEGAERRQFESGEREWLASVPFTIYAPTDLPSGWAVRTRCCLTEQGIRSNENDWHNLDLILRAVLLAIAVVGALSLKRLRRRRGEPAPEPHHPKGPPGWTWDPQNATWRPPDQ